jgi:hypothetical protein
MHLSVACMQLFDVLFCQPALPQGRSGRRASCSCHTAQSGMSVGMLPEVCNPAKGGKVSVQATARALHTVAHCAPCMCTGRCPQCLCWQHAAVVLPDLLEVSSEHQACHSPAAPWQLTRQCFAQCDRLAACLCCHFKQFQISY